MGELPTTSVTDRDPHARPAPGRLGRAAAATDYFWSLYRRTWRGSIIGRFLSPVMFLASIGLGLGALVDRSGGLGQTSYLHFVVPAFAVTQAMWLVNGEVTYPVMGHIKWDQAYRAMLASPLGVDDVLLAQAAILTFHLVTATTIFVAVAAVLGGFASWWAVLCIPIGVLTGLAFACPIFAFTVTQDDDTGFSILFRLVVTPLMLFSGTFFPVSSLPGWGQVVAWLTPLWHGVELSRSVAGGGPPLTAGAAAVHLAVLVLFVLGGTLAARPLFARRLVP